MTTSTWRTGRSNIDIEKHLRRSEVKAAQANSGWRWPGSLAAKANGTAIQAPDPTLSKATLRYFW